VTTASSDRDAVVYGSQLPIKVAVAFGGSSASKQPRQAGNHAAG